MGGTSSATLGRRPPFGSLLREWRAHRRMSQLALSAHSGISQRHISFLETGRSRPSRGMVLALAETLDVPLRERNVLLETAGFAGAYPDVPLGDDESAVFRAALEATLAHHEPYPALVLDGRWNMVMANPSALRFFGRFVDIGAAVEAIGSPPEFQMVRVCLHDEGLRRYIVNWQELAWSFLQRVRRALLVNPRDEGLMVLMEEIVGHPAAPAHWRQPDWSSAPAPALAMRMAVGDERYALFTMLAHFGSPQSVTLDELSVETFYPADEETRRRLLTLAG